MERLIWLDYLLIITFFIPVIIGLIRGFIRAIFGLIGMILGIGFAIPFSRPLGNLFCEILGFQYVFTGRIMAFCTIFLGCWILSIVIAWMLRKMMSALKLRWIDRLLGSCLGAIKGLFIGAFIMIIFTLTPQLETHLSQSYLGPHIASVVKKSVSFLPPTWQYYLNPERWIGISRYKLFSSPDTESHNMEN